MDYLKLLFFQALESGEINFSKIEGYEGAFRALQSRLDQEEALGELVFRRAILENECCSRSGFRAAVRLFLQEV